MIYCITCTTKGDVANYLYRDKTFIGSIKDSLKFEFRDDLIQDLFVYIMECPDKKIMEMNENGYIIFWFFGALRNQLTGSNKSLTTSLYRNFIFLDEREFDYLNEEEIIEDEDKIKIMKLEMDKLNKDKLTYTWRRWLEMYINGNETIEQLSKRLKIDKWNLVYGLRQVKKILKNNIECKTTK